MSQWKRVSRARKCPICQGDSWCTYTQTVVLCMRKESGHTKKISSGEMGWIHPQPDVPDTTWVPPKPVSAPTINCGKLLGQWRKETPDDELRRLAEGLGVSPGALVALNVVWAKEHHAWAFPMQDGYGNLVGFRLRNWAGAKFAVNGSHQGLFLPDIMPERTSIICEGPTDTAAALTLGFFALGRPSCSGGVSDLGSAIKRLGIARVAIIADNDAHQESRNGRNPGVNGAMSIQQFLRVPSCIVLLPAKDLRGFVNLGGTYKDINDRIANSLWRQPTSQTNQSTQVQL